MKKLLLIFIPILGFIFLSASSGVGEIQNRERSGTPDGDNVCSQCHNSSSFATIINLNISDSNGDIVTSYEGGEAYLLTYMVSETANSPHGLWVPIYSTSIRSF